MIHALASLTLAQANQRVPDVRALLATIMPLRAQIKALYRGLNQAGHQPADGVPLDATPQVARDFAVLTGMNESLQDYMDAVHATGCVVRDIEIGCVEWRGQHLDQPVWLRWQVGQASIAFFHLDTASSVHASMLIPIHELREPSAQFADPTFEAQFESSLEATAHT